jgi:uncharacterized protein (TIGR02217 family)
MTTASFGYQPGDGAGLDVGLTDGKPIATRYQNITGGTVIVDTIILLGVHTVLAGSFAVGLYSDAKGWPYNRLGVSAALAAVTVGDNAFDLSADPVSVPPGAFVWGVLQAPANLRVDGATATGAAVRASAGTTLTSLFGAGDGVNLIVPMTLFGSASFNASATELRLSEILAEPVTEGASALRLAEILSEPVTEGPSALRLAQILAEPVTEGPSALRLANIVCEAVISLPEEGEMVTDRLPLELGMTFESAKRPTFATQVRTSTSLRTTRNSLTPFPAWDFEVSFPYLPTDSTFRAASGTDFAEICGFFMKMHGQHGSFLYRDPQDHQVTAGALGTGDGVTTEFKFVRVMGIAEPVGQVDVDAGYTIHLDGAAVDPADFTFNQPNGLTFDVAPGRDVAITATFEFDFVCHFLSDAADFEQFNRDLFELRQIGFRADPA